MSVSHGANAITQPLSFGECYVTGGVATQLFRSGRTHFPISELGLSILLAESVRQTWRR